MKQKVVIIGAGLAGSLLSTYFAKRGIKTEVYEAQGDMRQAKTAAGRSINLALSNRGILPLKEVGMDKYMLKKAVPMHGRLIHSIDGATKLLPYSGREGEYINSVSRGGLNIALINEADKYPESTFHFNQRCVDFNCETGEALIENTETGENYKVKGDTLIATDGGGSVIRQAMFTSKSIERFNFSQDFLNHGYKELSIPPVSIGSGSDLLNVVDSGPDSNVQPPANTVGSDLFRMEKTALHIWARNQFMMIALPNFDGSYTCTLFLAHKGENSFEEIENGRYSSHGLKTINADKNIISDLSESPAKSAAKSLMAFFEDNFPDAIPLIPNLTEEFFTNPTGNLGTIKCSPWNVGGKSLLLGDSAHAVVPFYGQGMNASFEDCRILNELLDKHDTNWKKVFEEYGLARKKNTDAIADMAVENFYEMRDAVTDPIFVRKRELEMKLEQTFPDYFSKYSLVTFREEIPYSEAMKRGNAQNDLLMEICSKVIDIAELDLKATMDKINTL